MCGIVGYISEKHESLQFLIDGLERLEYRGYDSAGLAFKENDKLNIIKVKGRVNDLKRKIDFNIKSNIGIGHTRWATHGKPTGFNAHPHSCGKITIVHNGIIENYSEIKENYKEYKFLSQTDTEVAAVLLNDLYNKTNNILETIDLFQEEVRGSYAIVMLVEDIKDTLFAIKKNSPLVIGLNDGENYLASDIPAIIKYTNKYIILEDKEYAKITKDDVKVYLNGKSIKKETNIFKGDIESIDKLGFEHFMLKEINEEPEIIKNIIKAYLKNKKLDFKEYIPNYKKYNKICIIACGSAIHAGLIGKNLLEEYADIEVNVEIASEFRYKKLFLDEHTLVIPISQSGETADTLEALKIAKKYKCDTLGIINVAESSIARECKKVIYTNAGLEIAVATTKAYLAQVLILSLLSLYLAVEKELIKKEELTEILSDFLELPNILQSIINKTEYKEIAKILYNKKHVFFIGRQIDYSLCMEGSLKLKEISYIHSEAYAAGELKHGTISLIDNKTPVISLVTNKNIMEKTISNIKEVKARGGYIILITSEKLCSEAEFSDKKIILPTVHDLLQPIISVIPLQLIAYETAKLKKCDIDKPRNLAKSVTVE